MGWDCSLLRFPRWGVLVLFQNSRVPTVFFLCPLFNISKNHPPQSSKWTFRCFRLLKWFSNDCQKTKTKSFNQSKYEQTARWTNHNSQQLPATRSKRGKNRVQGAIAFGFASLWSKNWREYFKPITKHSNRNQVITFDSHLKTTLKTDSFFSVLYYIFLCPV